MTDTDTGSSTGCRRRRRRGQLAAIIITALAVAATLIVLIPTPSSTHPSHHHPNLRQLASSFSSSVPTDPAFRWDGTTSDLAQQFYRRHVAGDSAPSLGYSTADLPQRIRARLTSRNLEFATLPPLLQRALVWDSGFAFSPEPARSFIRMYTVNGVSMAHIAVSMAEYHRAGCNTTDCIEPNGVPAYRSKTCSGSMMLSVAHCASEDVTNGIPHMSMWATGGGDDHAVPTMNIERHSWDDKVFGGSFLVFAVHTTSDTNEPAWDNCPAPGVFTSAIIPCERYTPARAAQMNWTDPAPSALVDAWLNAVDLEAKTPVLVYICSIGGGLLVVIGGVFVGFYVWKRRRQHCDFGSTHGSNGTHYRAHAGGSSGRRQFPKDAAGGVSTDHALPQRRHKKDSTAYKTTPTADAIAMYRSAAAAGASSSTTTTTLPQYNSTQALLATLLNDPHLRTKRLDFAKLQFETELATGAFGEVWLCRYDRTNVVAVKRLLQQQQPHHPQQVQLRPHQSTDAIHAFVDEIQLTAALRHPNIIKVVGVAWNALENLCLVMEFYANGDLQAYLRAQKSQQQHAADAQSDARVVLTWHPHKLELAIGVARALTYLHSASPALIHRDIKARNVLLSSDLQAKVIDFGVSRSCGTDSYSDCMTIGVGTPYWTAPEVLEGTVYSEMSDIYSFGVLLAELDTETAPYHDAKTAGQHEPLQPFHILKLVMAGTLQPTFSNACPFDVKRIATQCLQRDPSRRPSARKVVAMLEAFAKAQVQVADDEDGESGSEDASGSMVQDVER